MNIYFLTGIPRAGNTILSSVFNQNPHAKISAHSVLPLLINSIIHVKNDNRFKNFPDFKGIETILSDALASTQNIIDSKKEYLLITYDDLINNIFECIKKICEFVNVPYIKPDLNNIRQLNINGVEYNDSVLSGNFHTIKTGKFIKNKTNIEEFLPQKVIDKYKNFDVRF